MILGALLALAAGCVAPGPLPGPSGGGSGSGGTSSGNGSGSGSGGVMWVAGDSISRSTQWPASVTPPPLSVAESSTGFIRAVDGHTIGSNLRDAIAQRGAPARVVIMGGVNDVRSVEAPSATQIIAVMSQLEADMVARGVEVIWATEPAWTYAAQMAPINDWVRTRPHYVDCGWSISQSPFNTGDGVHPTAAASESLGHCIDSRT